MKIEKVKTSALKINPANPRTIKDEKFAQLVRSIRDFPQMLEIRPIVVNKQMEVLGGNMRLRACIEAGLTEVPIIRAENLTEDQQREFIIKDNVGFGEWDWDALANQWDAAELADWGLDVPDFAAGGKPEAQEDDYEVPDEIETDIVAGDLFEIGPHRLLCGDSTKAEDVARLMAGETADIEILDPLFDMDYNTIYTTRPGVICVFTRGAKGFAFINSMCNNGYGYHNLVNLTPANGVAEETLPANTHEIIHVLRTVKYFDHNHALMFCKTEQQERATSVMNFGRPTTGDNYFKYAKPIGEISYLFAYCKSGAIVLDLFLGSGTTMVAAHQLSRKCYGMEIDPKYCQVIVDRMLKLDPEIEIKKNGQPYRVAENVEI